MQLNIQTSIRNLVDFLRSSCIAFGKRIFKYHGNKILIKDIGFYLISEATTVQNKIIKALRVKMEYTKPKNKKPQKVF